MKKFLILLTVLQMMALIASAQVKKPTPVPNPVKTSPAYAEVILRKTELLAELESLLIDYTEDYPKVKELRYQTELLQKDLDKMLAMTASDSSKFSLALGKLMVRKSDLDTDLWSLLQEFNDQHPDVKRAKRKSEIFDAAIKDILQIK